MKREIKKLWKVYQSQKLHTKEIVIIYCECKGTERIPGKGSSWKQDSSWLARPFI